MLGKGAPEVPDFEAAAARLRLDLRVVRQANEALRAERRIEKVYREAMGALLEVDDLREVTARRELYRRLARIGEVVVEVAERVWYAVVREG